MLWLQTHCRFFAISVVLCCVAAVAAAVPLHRRCCLLHWPANQGRNLVDLRKKRPSDPFGHPRLHVRCSVDRIWCRRRLRFIVEFRVTAWQLVWSVSCRPPIDFSSSITRPTPSCCQSHHLLKLLHCKLWSSKHVLPAYHFRNTWSVVPNRKSQQIL